MRTIVKEPRDILHTRCRRVTHFNEARRIAKDLLSVIRSVTRWWNRCLGFAANQIGYKKRIIALRKGTSTYYILINPEIIEKRFPFPYIETCFSLQKKKYYLVQRYLWAKVKYQDLEGNRCETILRGFSAIYQEIDHLNGIMVSDRGLRVW